MKEEIRLQLAQNTKKYDKLYIKQAWAVIIFLVLCVLFFIWFVKEILAPKVNPGLVVGGFFGFGAFLVISLGIRLLIKREIKKIENNQKLILRGGLEK